MKTLYKVTCPKTGDLVMIAPMNTLAHVFNLRDGAIARIVHDAINGLVCDIHFNYGKTKLGYSAINVSAEKLSERDAEIAALVSGNRYYVVRTNRRGEAVVWCSVSDHEVDFEAIREEIADKIERRGRGRIVPGGSDQPEEPGQ
jgi:hypothetical protein